MATAIACVPEPDPGLPGEHVTYHHDESLDLCGGTLSYLDGFVAWTAASLGLEIENKIHYHWLSPDEFLNVPCEDYARGCFYEGQVYSTKPAHPHELVHAVTAQNGMNHLLFFTEGIAVALDPLHGGGTGPRYRAIPETGPVMDDPRLEMTAQDSLDISYELAGAFVSFLLFRHGSEKFVALTRQLAADMDYPEIVATFTDVYGLNLDDEVEAFMANDACDDRWTAVTLHDCAAENVPWVDEIRWHWKTSMDCEDPAVVGGSGLEQWDSRSFRAATVEIPTAGYYEIFTESTSTDTDVTLGRCFGCPWQPRDVAMGHSERRIVEFAAGKHFVRITGDPTLAPDVQVLLQWAGPPDA